MMLLVSLILALIPLLGVVWVLIWGSPATVDGLFAALILLTISACFGLNVLIELRKRMTGSTVRGTSPVRSKAGSAAGDSVRRGRVEDVVFFESNVGQPNKSIVTLSNGSSPQTLVIEGDMRNALPKGQKVSILMRREGNENVLVDVSYS